ncbi:prephenate dehydratase [Clostridium tyrobutyricum]|uniref:prephenate dehydratase n=1 Tax=Clostridium tyrobutyricum TaxID=1519 RepID=UPI0011CCBE28|nr:prephenate dehydratase [Clostridium tyrobutyricum]
MNSFKNYKVGFYGVEASFSHEALLKYFGNDTDALSCAEFKDVFDSLSDGHIKYGVVPIENSSTGGILDVYDLMRDYGFYIVGEKCIKINHNLLGIKGSKIDDIDEVYSHSQAFLQCKKFLVEHDNWELTPYFSTARSAKFISEIRLKNKACIASEKAAELYGLDILKQNINYNKNNYTRFIVIGKEEINCEDKDKISIVFTLDHRVGTLFNILRYFKENNLNLIKIESRPIIDEPWQYFFYLDFNGNIMKKDTRIAMEGIKNNCKYFRILGNYKADF